MIEKFTALAANSFMKIQSQNLIKKKEAVPEGRASVASSLARDFTFLCGAPRINDEHERDQLLEEKPRIPLNPHEPPAGDVHEDIPEITTGSFFRKQVGPDEESQHEADFQPLIDGGDATKIVEAVAEPKRDADEREAVKPAWWIASCATESENETQEHCRSTTRFYRSRNPVPPHDEDDDPWRQTKEVHRPRGNPPLARACVLAAVACVLREPQKDLVEEVTDTSPHLQEDVHSDLLRIFECALPRPLAWQSSWNYVFSTILELNILEHKSQEAASAASWERLKNFSFLLLQNMVRADVLTGSLAVFRFAAKPLIFAGGFLAAAGGEMRSNYFKNGAPRRKSQYLATRNAPLGDQIVWSFRGKKKFPIPLKAEKKNFSKS